MTSRTANSTVHPPSPAEGRRRWKVDRMRLWACGDLVDGLHGIDLSRYRIINCELLSARESLSSLISEPIHLIVLHVPTRNGLPERRHTLLAGVQVGHARRRVEHLQPAGERPRPRLRHPSGTDEGSRPSSSRGVTHQRPKFATWHRPSRFRRRRTVTVAVCCRGTRRRARPDFPAEADARFRSVEENVAATREYRVVVRQRRIRHSTGHFDQWHTATSHFRGDSRARAERGGGVERRPETPAPSIRNAKSPSFFGNPSTSRPAIIERSLSTSIHGQCIADAPVVVCSTSKTMAASWYAPQQNESGYLRVRRGSGARR